MNHGGVFDLCMAGYASDYRHKFLKVKPISNSINEENRNIRQRRNGFKHMGIDNMEQCQARAGHPNTKLCGS